MRLALSLASIALSLLAYTADAKTIGSDWRLDASINPMWMIPSNPVLRGNNPEGKRVLGSMGPTLEVSARNLPGTLYSRWYPGARQGVGVSVQPTIPNSVLGTPVLVYALQSATLGNLDANTSIEYEWNFGAALGWKSKNHNDTDYDREKDCVGSPYTAYINIGVYLRRTLTDNLSIFGGFDLRHYSNGNTKDPNPGLNMLGMRLGASYRLGEKVEGAAHDWSDFEPGVAVDVIGYGTARKWAFHPDGDINNQENFIMLPGHYAVVGVNVNPLYRFNPIFAAGVSVDAHYDHGANLGQYRVAGTPDDNPQFRQPPFRHQYMVGLSARAEARMALFAINVGVGHSVIAPGGPDLRGWYNTFVLKTFITDRFFIHTGYRLVHFTHQGNLMMGLGIRL